MNTQCSNSFTSDRAFFFLFSVLFPRESNKVGSCHSGLHLGLADIWWSRLKVSSSPWTLRQLTPRPTTSTALAASACRWKTLAFYRAFNRLGLLGVPSGRPLIQSDCLLRTTVVHINWIAGYESARKKSLDRKGGLATFSPCTTWKDSEADVFPRLSRWTNCTQQVLGRSF